uniref:Uncharacterized protein n=1 Tax=Physcomitrium patens TaxID=3218 RepID=A0A2K1JRA0_PHYPA|nr:hypothetical protein PHYPA_016450 [Physcomitrium patens]
MECKNSIPPSACSQASLRTENRFLPSVT